MKEYGGTPAAGTERYEFLDVLRGASLMGIVLANMISYSLYLYLPEAARAGMTTAAIDRRLDFLELVLVEGKFYTIFSVLFGIGFSLLLARHQAKGLRFQRFFLRRVGLLSMIGLAHAILFWHNDILVFYALCGALLLPFARAGNRTILAAAAAALVAPVVLKVFETLPPDSLSAPRDYVLERFGLSWSARVDTWAHGNVTDNVLFNLSSWFTQVDFVITSGMLFKIYGCFLLGLYLGRNEVFKNLSSHAHAIKRVALLGVVIGIPLNVIYARTFESESLTHVLVAAVAILPLSAGYAALVAWLWIRTSGAILTRLFAPVGRMALTNYVGQSVICMLIFRGVGFELGGTIGPAFYIPLGLAIYVAQLFASRLWLQRCHFGPLEWVWRMLSYGRWVPLARRPVTAEAQA